jgi:hypothetical protein
MTTGVRVEVWREFCYRSGITDSGKQDSKQKAFRRAANDLVARKLVGIWDDWAWPLPEPEDDEGTLGK